ncbi:hypothetical protein MLD52_00070 [Puniceicoccaceae bacterium K14]|nr:hypothetical protein [Puniceicoccaceae bacterium K14]
MKSKNFFGTPPSNQNAIDIFEGQWSSYFPDSYETQTGGSAGLFEDERLLWAQENLGGFQNKRILELGPLEGGHSFMIEQMGAEQIDSIEANSEAYLRCLVTKEICKLRRTNFLLGDFTRHIETSNTHYHTGIACGVLYHQRDPINLIRLLASCCDSLFIWTHYFEKEAISKIEHLKGKFAHSEDVSCEGYEHTLHHYEYGKALEWNGFCGADYASACWLSEDDILNGLQYFGYEITAKKYEPNPNGAAIWLSCKKQAQ